jgi:DHA2 family methylenomycin A resistance protein-like MFS transporter
MLPLSLFRSRTFTVSTVMGLLINTCFYGLIFLLSLLFQREQHLSPLQTGLALLPMTIAITVANLVAGSTSRRIGPGGAVAAGALLIGAAAAGLLGVEASTPYGEIVGQTTLLGFGTGLSIAVITNLTLGSVDQSRSGIAGGTLNTARQTGSAIGVAVFGSLIAATFIAGLHLALAISVALMLAVTGLTQLLARRPLRSRRRKHAPEGRLHDRPAINREPDRA